MFGGKGTSLYLCNQIEDLMKKFIFGFLALMLVGGLIFGTVGSEDDFEYVAKKSVNPSPNRYHYSKQKEYWLDEHPGNIMASNDKELRRAFESAPKVPWNIGNDQYTVEYPDFMRRGEYRDDSYMQVYYHDVSLTAKIYKDDYDMTVQEKFEAVCISAVTKSVGENSFMMAGRCGENKRFFEKDILLESRTWMYIRVEFPSELTWAIDPLLQYVKNYEPYCLSPGLRRL